MILVNRNQINFDYKFVALIFNLYKTHSNGQNNIF